MVKRKRTVPLQVTIILVLLLCLIPPLAWVQYQWTGLVSAADERRMRENLRATGMQFMMALENEVTVIHDMLEAERGAATPGDTITYVEQAVQFWVGNASYPGLLSSVSVLDLGETRLDPGRSKLTAASSKLSIHQYLRAADGSYSWKTTSLGDADPGLVSSLLAMNWLQAQSAAASPLPAERQFVGSGSPFFLARLVSPEPPVIVISQIDPAIIGNDILPALAKRYFAEPDGLAGYQLRVVERTTGQVLWQNTPQGAAAQTGRTEPELSLPLLGAWRPKFVDNKRNPDARSPDYPRIRYWLQSNDRPLPPVDQASWILEVRRMNGSFEESAARVRWINLSGSMGLLLLIAFGLTYLYRLYRQSRVMVRTQEDFVATVSHELKTPLSVLRSAAENLREGVVTDVTRTKRYGEHMVNEADRLLKMTENVLRYARLEHGGTQASDQVAPFDLARLIRETVNDWKSEFAQLGAELHYHHSVLDDTIFQGEAQAIRALLDNLLTNARRYGLPEGGGGRVEVRLAQRTQEAKWRWLPFANQARRAWFVLSVQDNGPGIPRRDQKRLFQPFARPQGSPTGGIGLGLSLVRRIAQAHGGTVRVEHNRGGKTGVCFVVELPHARNPAAIREDQAPS